MKDSSGKKGLSLIIKTTDEKKKSTVVIKPLDDVASKSDTDDTPDNNEHSSSRPVGDGDVGGVVDSTVDQKQSPTVTESEKKKDNSDEKMDLSRPVFSNNLDELMPNLDDVLGLNNSNGTNRIHSQHDEAQIQKITSNLEATGASYLQQSVIDLLKPSSTAAPSPLLPNTSFSHHPGLPQQLPPAMVRPPAAAARTSSQDSGLSSSGSTPTAAGPPALLDMLHRDIESYTDGDNSPRKLDPATGIKVLTPMKLNEKAPTPGVSAPAPAPSSAMMTPPTPTQQIHVRGISATPTRILVQNPASARPGLGAGEYLAPLNSRLQTRPSMPAVIRISAPASVTMSLPASLLQSTVTSPAPVMSPQAGQNLVNIAGLVPGHGATNGLAPGTPVSSLHSVVTSGSGVVLAHPPQVRPGVPQVRPGALLSPQGQLRPGAPQSPQVLPPGAPQSPMMRPGGPQSPQVMPPGAPQSPMMRAGAPQSPQVPTPGAPQSAQVRPGVQQSPPVRPGAPQPAAPGAPGVRSPRPRGGVRMRGGVRPGVRPRMVLRPGAPAPRGMRPRGPPPAGMRPGMRPGGPVRGARPGMRPGGPPRGPRPGQPGAAAGPRPAGPRPAVRPAAPPAPAPAAAPAAAVKPEVIDLSDDDEVKEERGATPPPAAKSATLEKLKACGISISKQKAPQLPSNVRLPPGISLSGAGSSSAPKRASTSSYTASPARGEPSNKRVAVDTNVASALASVGGDSNEPKKKVELELSDKQMAALQALGLL